MHLSCRETKYRKKVGLVVRAIALSFFFTTKLSNEIVGKFLSNKTDLTLLYILLDFFVITNCIFNKYVHKNIHIRTFRNRNNSTGVLNTYLIIWLKKKCKFSRLSYLSFQHLFIFFMHTLFRWSYCRSYHRCSCCCRSFGTNRLFPLPAMEEKQGREES